MQIKNSVGFAATILLGLFPFNKDVSAKDTDINKITRPNVVFIISDDHRQDLMSCSGHKFIKTPNLDRLATEGILFNNAFCCSGVCTPSRASFLTGKYAFQAGVPKLNHARNNTFMKHKTFMEILNSAGYYTGHVGKWHLGEGKISKRGYDYWAGFDRVGAFFEQIITINGKEKYYSKYTDDVLSDLAAKFIEKRSKEDEPFALYLGLKAPHLPYDYPVRLRKVFKNDDIPKPVSFDEDLKYEEVGKLGLVDSTIRIKNWWSGIKRYETWDNYIKSYYRSSLSIDGSVKTVLEAIEKAGIQDNTIVIYTSDQGYHNGEHGLTEKHYPYEDVLKIPMIMRYPKLIKQGIKSDELVCSIDIAPTILDLCGIDIPEDIPGKSWKNLLENDGKVDGGLRDETFFSFVLHSPGIQACTAVRTSKYKLISYTKRKSFELYDIEKDPDELKNLVDDPAYKEILVDMKSRLEKKKKETGWSELFQKDLTACYVLGPFSRDMDEKVRQEITKQEKIDYTKSINVEDKVFEWKLVRSEGSVLNISEALDGGNNCFGYISVPMTLKTKIDPWTSLIVDRKNAGPMAAYHKGNMLLENKLNQRLNTYKNVSRFIPVDNTHYHGLNPFFQYNPPLQEGENDMLIRVFARKDVPFLLKSDFLIFPDKVMLPLQ